ncbi:hypothetical protein CHU98_g7060 [Xylaria longipes]|nr:hypothetical protein CHU98_g7060 [Xylaria longipes]
MYSIQAPDENPAWREIIFNSVFSILTIMVVGLRLCSRRLTRAGFGWDDCFILIATLLVNGMIVVAGFLIYLGFGLSVRQIAPGDLKKVTELDRTFRLLFLLCICVVKLSALFFYLRVFGTRTLCSNRISHSSSSNNTNPGTNTSLSDIRLFLRPFCRFTQGFSLRFTYIFIICVVVAWSVANIVQELAVCHPDKPMCASQRNTDLGICVFNAGGDLLILLLPLWPIWRLQMNQGTKMGLSFVFLLGIVTTAVAFLRFEAIVHTDYGGDYNRTAMKSVNYAILEPNFAIMCISLPMLQPPLRKALSYVKTKLGGRTGGRFTNSWARNPLGNKFTHWRNGGLSRIFTTPKEVSASSGNSNSTNIPKSPPPKGAHVDFQPPAIPLSLRPSSDGRRSGTGTRDTNGGGSLVSRARSLWRTDSHGSSQDELVELASGPVAAGCRANSLCSEDCPRSPQTGVTITVTGGKE